MSYRQHRSPDAAVATPTPTSAVLRSNFSWPVERLPTVRFNPLSHVRVSVSMCGFAAGTCAKAVSAGAFAVSSCEDGC